VEDRNHFEALFPRIYELGASLPKDPMKTVACVIPSTSQDIGKNLVKMIAQGAGIEVVDLGITLITGPM